MKVQVERFHLTGHIIGFHPQTQKLESPYKTPSSTLAVKGLKMNDFIYGLSTKYINFIRIRRTIPPHLKIAKKRPFFVWNLTLGATFWKPVTKSSKPRTEYVRLLFP